MTYIPVTPYVAPPPSPRARELSRRISELIERYEQENPGVSATEIRQALTLATSRSGSSSAVLWVVVGLVLALLAAMLLLFRG